jgi:hypothetical protein
VLSITIVSDAPNCGVTYDCQSDDHNSFVIQATGLVFKNVLQPSKKKFQLLAKVSYELRMSFL